MSTCLVTELRCSRALAFGLLSDTNRWDRLVAVAPTRYSLDALDPADPERLTRVGRSTMLWRSVRFVEDGTYWAPERLHGERRFLGGFGRRVVSAFLDVETTEHDGTTRVVMRGGAEVRGVIGWLLGLFVCLRVRMLGRRYLRGIARAVAAASSDAQLAETPPAAQARQLLLQIGDAGAPVTGRHTACSAELAQRADRYAAAPIDASIRGKVLDLVTTQPDEALLQVRPFELATAWGADRREVLRAFVHAARAGLFDLEWKIDCPTCRVGTDWAPKLDRLGQRVHCDECDIAFDLDFASNVEATFTVNPAVRKVSRVQWCASSPFWRPHVHGYVTIAPGQTWRADSLPPGPILLRTRDAARQLRCDDRSGPIGVRISAARITQTRAAADEAALVVENTSATPVRLLVERAGWEADRVLGSAIVGLHDFVEVFGTEAPATGIQLSVGVVAVLFTDLVGSTELYEQLGDARAFALIQRHWARCQAAAARHGGAVIKSLGDGLFCTFPTLAEAAAAALDMIEEAERIAARERLRFAVRAAIHEGPCYLVRGNDRLDLFGSTVNTASRLLPLASGSQLAVLATALDDPGVWSVLEDAGAAVQTVQTPLRGMRGTYKVAVATRPDATVVTTGEFAPVAVAAIA